MDQATALSTISGWALPTYHRYDELTSMVEAFAAAYPELCTRRSVGRSAEGRELWLLTLSNQKTGSPDTKPALLIEANIHAGEVTGCAAALATAKRLLTQYGEDRDVTRLLDGNTVYVIPRVAVDGTEFYLTRPEMVRSSPLPYPETAPDTEGLLAADIDGDGRIRLMRKADPLGEWKVSSLDPRIMVRRLPEDWEGPFYRLYSEGALLKPEGRKAQALTPARANRGLDFNRNFPAHWNPEAKQPGAGRYPLDQPETRALAEFMLSRPNISVYLALHTYGGVLLRPPSVAGDESISPADLRLFEALGQLCERTTTYPCKSSHHAFFHTPGQPMVKGSKDWAYEQLGMVAYTMELWDLDARAGAHAYRDIGMKGLLKLSEAEREQDELKRLAWNDRELNGQGFKNWAKFDHPDLGEVEIGGWDEKLVRQNCPLKFLPEECRRVSEFALKLGLTLPQLMIRQVRTTQLEGGAWRVEAEVANAGFLATNTTKTAIAMKAVKPVEAALEPGKGVTFLAGRPSQELGQLDGFGSAQDSLFYGAPGAARRSAWAEWVVAAQPGAEITVRAAGARGGSAQQTFRLGQEG